MTSSSDHRQLLARLVKQGWRLQYSGAGHIKAYPPGGGPYVLIASTPSGYRALMNAKAALKCAGYREK